MDWLDLHAVQGTLKSLLQHHSLKASVLQCSAFFMIQLSQDYWKSHSFDYTNTCLQSDISIFFNTLSRSVIGFLSRSKHLLISWLQSLSTVILEPKKRKFVVSIFPPSSCHEVMEPDAMILVFWMLSFKPDFSLSFSHAKRQTVVWGGLKYTEKRKEAKGRGEKESYKHLNEEFQRMARREKKAFLSDQSKEIEENNRMEKTRDLFKKIRDTRGKDGLNKGQKWYGPNRSRSY